MYIYSDFRSKSINILPKDNILKRKEHRKISMFHDNILDKSINELKKSNLKKSEFLNNYKESEKSTNYKSDFNSNIFPTVISPFGNVVRIPP